MTSVEDLHRRSDPSTSVEAAQRIHPLLGYLRRCVFSVLMRNYPGFINDLQVNEQCTELFGPRPESSYRHRRSDLKTVYVEIEPNVLVSVIECGGDVQYKGSKRKVWRVNPLVIEEARRWYATDPHILPVELQANADHPQASH